MATKKRALGKGLDALIRRTETPGDSSAPPPAQPHHHAVRQIPLDKIKPNPNQPRQFFDEEHLEELASSIKIHGVLQPLLLKQDGEHYRLVAGERRWRAARQAGLETVPALIEDYSDEAQLEIALIENIQREDLNALEEARAYQQLISKYGLSQERVSEQVGKARATVANSLRLLKLPVSMQRDIEAGRLTAGHARALLSLDSPQRQEKLHKAILADDLSVRAAERMARHLSERKPPKPQPVREVDPQIKALEDRLIERLGALTRIRLTSPTQGRIEINYASLDDLDRILMLIGVEADSL